MTPVGEIKETSLLNKVQEENYTTEFSLVFLMTRISSSHQNAGSKRIAPNVKKQEMVDSFNKKINKVKNDTLNGQNKKYT